MHLFTKWKDKIIHYVEVRFNLIKLELIERTSAIVSRLIFSAISMLFVITIFILLGFAMAELFTVLFNGSRVAGYFAAIGVYVFFLIILFFFRKSIRKEFAGMFIRLLTSDDDDKEKKKDD